MMPTLSFWRVATAETEREREMVAKRQAIFIVEGQKMLKSEIAGLAAETISDREEENTRKKRKRERKV